MCTLSQFTVTDLSLPVQHLRVLWKETWTVTVCHQLVNLDVRELCCLRHEVIWNVNVLWKVIVISCQTHSMSLSSLIDVLVRVN